jgi:serine/threonine protein kinase
VQVRARPDVGCPLLSPPPTTLAHPPATGQVAIKIIHKSQLAKRNELFRAANEIAALQLLKHQNIISLYQVLESRSRVFLVMEYCKGGTFVQRPASLAPAHPPSLTQLTVFFFLLSFLPRFRRAL